MINLAAYDKGTYHPGRPWYCRCLWYVVSQVVFESGWIPLSLPKAWLLRLFGARVGRGLVIKPGVRIKHPWRLELGDHCWIGQSVWIDNLTDVRIGSHVCLSQGVYLCTGSHDYRRTTFDLIARPIAIGDGAWLAARALVFGGVTIGQEAVVGGGAVIIRDVAAHTLVAGNPARVVDHSDYSRLVSPGRLVDAPLHEDFETASHR
jgi:putative colanic acid biosynthesis acetyltransferase WcaF